MQKGNRHKLAACGIDCNECGQYKVTFFQDIDSAEGLVPWFRSMDWIKKNDGAEAVLKKSPLCKGCWAISNDRAHFCADCFLRKCCEERQLNHCGECGDFPCAEYIKFVGNLDHHKKAMEYLLSLNKNKKGEKS